jgi:dTDP-4-dehydrorhamnose reductase
MTGPVLVAGAGGQLGRELVRVFGAARQAGLVVGLTHAELDVSDRAAVHAAVATHRPGLVVNCAAWTDVDGCELDPELAHRVNAAGSGFLREACDDVGAHLVQISTDYVFDGEASTPYPEDHPTGPVNVYGASKLAGEVAAGPAATVVRTTWLQPADGPGAVGNMLDGLRGDSTVRVLGDRRACPTFVADLAPVISRLGVERVAGVVHATNAGETSWYEFALVVAELVGADPELVVRIAEADLVTARPARRPCFSALDNVVLRDLGYEPMRHHRGAIVDAVARLDGQGA